MPLPAFLRPSRCAPRLQVIAPVTLVDVSPSAFAATPMNLVEVVEERPAPRLVGYSLVAALRDGQVPLDSLAFPRSYSGLQLRF